MDTETGAVEGWVLPADLDASCCDVSKDNRLIALTVRVLGDWLTVIHDRGSGVTFQTLRPWDRVVAFRANRVLVARFPEPVEGRVGNAILTLVDLDRRTAWELAIPPNESVTGIFSRDASRLAVAAGYALYLVDTTDATVTRVGQRTLSDHLQPLPRDAGFQVAKQLYAWDGTKLRGSNITGELSPDLRLTATWTAPFIVARQPDAGSWETLTILTVSDAMTGEPHFRILGGLLPTRVIMGGSHWLADGSALLVETEAGDLLVAPRGEVLGPAPSAPGETWAVPSPDNRTCSPMAASACATHQTA